MESERRYSICSWENVSKVIISHGHTLLSGFIENPTVRGMVRHESLDASVHIIHFMECFTCAISEVVVKGFRASIYS